MQNAAAAAGGCVRTPLAVCQPCGPPAASSSQGSSSSDATGAGPSSQSAAAAAVLSSPDLLLNIMLQLSLLAHGWGRSFWRSGACVCEVWRDAVLSARPLMEEWCTYRWHVKDFAKLLKRPMSEEQRQRLGSKGELYSPVFVTGYSYAWQLLLFPGGVNFEYAHIPDELGMSKRALALYLAVADGSTLEACSRQTQFELTVHSHRQEKTVIRDVREHRFEPGKGDWGFRDMLSYSQLLDPQGGFIARDGSIVISLHVRVRNERRFCPDAPHHALKLADPDIIYARFRGNWWCDRCKKVREHIDKELGRPSLMYHCQRGCEYDLCEACMIVRHF